MKNLELIAVYYGISKWVPDWYIEEGLIKSYECYSLFYNKEIEEYYVFYGSAGEQVNLNLLNTRVFKTYNNATEYIESEMNIARYASNIPF